MLPSTSSKVIPEASIQSVTSSRSRSTRSCSVCWTIQRRVGERRILPAVIEVQMRVDHPCQSLEPAVVVERVGDRAVDDLVIPQHLARSAQPLSTSTTPSCSCRITYPCTGQGRAVTYRWPRSSRLISTQVLLSLQGLRLDAFPHSRIRLNG